VCNIIITLLSCIIAVKRGLLIRSKIDFFISPAMNGVLNYISFSNSLFFIDFKGAG
jgi:hypothetical protein